MCEKCRRNTERNTEIKRATVNALFTPNPVLLVGTIAGYPQFLALCRQLERVCEAPPVNGQPDPEELVLYRARIRALTWQERTDVLRLSAWVAEHVAGLHQHVAGMKQELKDPDVTLIEVRVVEGAIEVTQNGVVAQRIPFGPDVGVSEAEAIDAAEMAMRQHRDQLQHPQHPSDG